MSIDLTIYNDKVKAWGNRFVGIAKAKGSSLGISHRSNSPSPAASLPKIKDKYRIGNGAINKVTITFSRSLIYTMNGSGKGIGGIKGSRWLNAKGEQKRTNGASLGKLGTGNRKAKDFINQALDTSQGVTELSEIAAGSLGDAIITGVKIS